MKVRFGTEVLDLSYAFPVSANCSVCGERKRLVWWKFNEAQRGKAVNYESKYDWYCDDCVGIAHDDAKMEYLL